MANRRTARRRPADVPSPDHDGRSRRELAVARSIDSARARAENRVQRFMDSAVELINAGAGTDFTVQEVVERSGQSLRSFYQYFEGKHELLLALFEESVLSTVDYLRQRLEDEDDPRERLHIFVVEYYQMCRPTVDGVPTRLGANIVMAEFAWQLVIKHPREAARAFAPLVAMFRKLVDEAVDAGVVRPDLSSERLLSLVLGVLMFNVFALTVGGTSVRDDRAEAAEEAWDVLMRGIAQPGVEPALALAPARRRR